MKYANYTVILLLILATGLGVMSLVIKHAPATNNQKSGVATQLPATASASVKTPRLTLDQIFIGQHSPQPSDVITLTATGDIIPARSVNYMTTTKYKDFTWPYLKTKSLFENSDLSFINLESPLVKGCGVRNEGMIFCGDPKNIEGLKYINVNVASFANNHMGNQGDDGIIETKKLFEENGIQVTGIKGANIVYKTVKNTTFAFLGYNMIEFDTSNVSWYEKSLMEKEVHEAKTNADVVVVTFHWGAEYNAQPSTETRQIAHDAIDFGADLIIGNHPHWIQPVEIYKDKVIAYAHGNFVFDQMWSLETEQGVVGKYYFLDKKLVDVEFVPIQILNYGQPYMLEGLAREKVLTSMYKQSQKLL